MSRFFIWEIGTDCARVGYVFDRIDGMKEAPILRSGLLGSNAVTTDRSRGLSSIRQNWTTVVSGARVEGYPDSESLLPRRALSPLKNSSNYPSGPFLSR